MEKHVSTYMDSFKKFRSKICVPKAEGFFNDYLKAYRGQGYWIPEFNGDVDVESIALILPEFEKKLNWIRNQKQLVVDKSKLPPVEILNDTKYLLDRLLDLKKDELSFDEKLKIRSRQQSLKFLEKLETEFLTLVKKVPYLTNYSFPIDHLKNRKVYDEYREKEDAASVRVANYTFLYRKILEDGAYYSDHTGSDIYLRTTLDTLYFELKQHDFYLTEDARYDFDFVLSKIESELNKGKSKMLERLSEWEQRTEKTFNFYKSLTLPANNLPILVNGKKTTPNRQLIEEHNIATERLKDFVYKKQAEVYNYWLHQGEIPKALFVIETILLNEVGRVDGDDALERMDVARVVKNRQDKPKYLSIGNKDFIYPYLKKVVSDHHLKSERWLNALFKQGEFSFTYYYMNGVSMIFCPDISKEAKKLRTKNVEIALQVLKEEDHQFMATRYFSRASMIGRIHMDSIWEDYAPFAERPGLLASGQDRLNSAWKEEKYKFLYNFKDPIGDDYQVLEINNKVYSMKEKAGIKLFYQYRNPHYFRYFTKRENLGVN